MGKVLLFCFLLVCLHSHAQLLRHSALHYQPALVVSNGKTTRRYSDGRALKIHYYNNGRLVKAKGRLLIDSNQTVELIPYRRDPVAVISTDSITSVSRWNRKSKFTLLVLGATGVAVGALGAATLLPNSGDSEAELNIVSFLLILTAATDIYYVIVATPVVFISEWLSVRSEKRGYHFSIE